MTLQSMTAMLKRAQKYAYAVGAFNILDYNSMKAVVDAAEELHSPVIIQTSVKTVLFWGYEPVIAWARQLAENATVSIAIHLDHCKDLKVIQNCIDAGWTSVMIDASTMPFEENIALTQKTLEMARPKNISVEAELGAIVGVEDDIHVKEQDAHLADPEQAVQFCHTLAIDCFAPAIGTAHGVYKGEPRIAYHRIEEIARRTGVPLALHGGTGLSEDVFYRCIALGCAKVNISTQLKYAHINGFVDYHLQNKVYNPLKPLQAQYEALKAAVMENIKLFGSEGKA
ncbi:class II fructose-bisphosphate aldolase [candidate division KSB1 bacterium]|nr:class II fructose-bisphosphate aldolase [candidate division KSB1 bacterium]